MEHTKNDEERLKIFDELKHTLQCLHTRVFRYKKDKKSEYGFTLSEGKMAEKYEITTDKIKGKTIQQIFNKEIYDAISPYFERAFNGEILKYQMNYSEQWFETTLSPFARSADGNVVEIIGSTEEITERKMAIDELQKIEKKYRILIETAGQPVFTIRKEGIFKSMNNTAAKYLGGSPKDFIGKTMWDIFPKEIADRQMSNITKVFSTGELKPITEKTIIQGESRVFETRIQIIPTTLSKEPDTALVITKDITEARQVEDFINIQNELYIALGSADNLEDICKYLLGIICKSGYFDCGGIYFIDKVTGDLNLICHKGLSSKFAKRGKRFTKNSQQYKMIMKGKPIYKKFNDISPDNDIDSINEGLCIIAVIPLLNQKKVVGCLNISSHIHHEISLVVRIALESIAERIGGVIVRIESQQELKEAYDVLLLTLKKLKNNQQLLIQKSKLESLGELAAGIAHEINQPLGVMSLSMENLQLKISSNEATPEYIHNKLNSIDSNISRIREIVDHIRTFSHESNSITIEKVNVNKVIANALLLIGTQYQNHNININLDLQENIGFSIGSKLKFEQVILNLLSNAKYAVDECAINYSESEYTKVINIKTSATEKKITISVEDNGIGIKTENLTKVFEPFFTSKPEGIGTGLGLSIVYGIIKEMRGDIIINSKRNKYTKVEIFLPRFPEND
ncbi:MAG: PAS domain-containing protein [Bacteroidales bacterium]|nr:PAS domain-containing protein [Bacteroidales bacterium]